VKIELLLRARLLKDSLSSMLTEAGFSISHESDRHNDHGIVIVDFDEYQNVVLAHQQRDAKIVLLTRDAESVALNPDEIAALSGVLTFDLSANSFVQSLRLIASGERVFPHGLTLERATPVPQAGNISLSPREREVLLEVVEGHSNKVIAHHLGMTEATAKVHLKSILRKIRVDNRTQAAIWALNNLPELDPSPRGLV
jgi:two-component system, NarL family, nitrate/nitrite response regulator NarL